jgi:hypothetical protein
LAPRPVQENLGRFRNDSPLSGVTNSVQVREPTEQGAPANLALLPAHSSRVGINHKKIDTECKIQDAESYLAAMTALNKQDRPPAVLRVLMNAFESYRQVRKIGWSRPWNKYGIKTFRSYRLDLGKDSDLIALARDILNEAGSDVPESARDYVNDLLDDGPEARTQLMGFIFFHEIDDGKRVFEGATLSFGRKVKKRYRDRLDFIFEAPMLDGRAGRFTRLRIFVNPFQGVKPPLWETECSADFLPTPSRPRYSMRHVRTRFPGWRRKSPATRLTSHHRCALQRHSVSTSSRAESKLFP